MDVREKLVEVVCDAMESDGCIGYCNHSPCFEVERVVNALIDNGVTVQEWISVKDKLPEESGMYIVTANDGHAQRVSFVLWQKKNRRWNLTGARSYWRVTHWQPLPQPPKGE